MKTKRNRKFSNKLRKWNNLLLKDFDWDFAFLLEIERMKLSYMLEYFSKPNLVIDGTMIIRDLKLCIKLLDIYSGRNSCTSQYVNFRNYKRFWPKMLRTYIDENKYIKDELRSQKAFHLYHLIRLYKLQTWWE